LIEPRFINRLGLADHHDPLTAHGMIKTVDTPGMAGWPLLIDQ
jgi:hypothetical protein